MVHARLTPAGQQVVEETAADHFANEARMLATLTVAEKRQLAGLLRKLEQSIITAETSDSVSVNTA